MNGSWVFFQLAYFDASSSRPAASVSASFLQLNWNQIQDNESHNDYISSNQQ